MKQYWVKLSADAQADGPLDARELRRRVAGGEIRREHFLSIDEVRWYRAERMKHLAFPAVEESPGGNGDVAHEVSDHQELAQEETPAQPVAEVAENPFADATSAPPAVTEFDISETDAALPIDESTIEAAEVLELNPVEAKPPPPLFSLGSSPSTPRVRPTSQPTATNRPAAPFHSPAMQSLQPEHVRIRPRDLTLFWILSIVLFVTLTFVQVCLALQATEKTPPAWIDFMGLAGLTFFVCAVVALVVWLLWLNRVHEEVYRLSHGHYPISSAKAIGFSFLPIFNLYWSVTMPLRLCREVNHHLTARALPLISCKLVGASQIISILIAPVLPGAVAVLNAASMSQIQRGLNRLAKH
jgi:hypothetical protein